MIRSRSAYQNAYKVTAVLIYTTALVVPPMLTAQTLPAPSRTIYKCKIQGSVTYSDTPCLGAKKLDVEPTRGVSKLSGTERIGADVAHEHEREGFAQALRPLSGMDAKQFAVFSRRYQLPAATQQECRDLDQNLPHLESEEQHATPAALRDVQARLFQMRTRFRNLRC